MPTVKERGVPHGTFTDHWIRVVTARSAQSTARRSNDRPIEPYYERDKTGPEAKLYQGMGEIVYATQASDGRALVDGVTALERALGKDTTRDEAHFFLGIAYDQLGRTDAAIRALEQSVRSDSNHPDRLRALAQAYERVGRAPAAVDQLYRRALTLQPALAWIRAEHADFLQAQGRRNEAEEGYRRALAEQPSLAVARFNLGTLLTEEGRLREASEAFREAVHRDPLLAEALSRLLEIRTTGKVVSGVRGLGSPLATLPVRARNPRAVQMTLATEAARPGVRFLNVPARGLVQIVKPNGTLVRALPTGEGWALSWDLLTETGNPIAGGLYRARVQGRDASGRPVAPQLLYFAVVRHRAE
jgi:tetratricopeptide (TPR) repeat protein